MADIQVVWPNAYESAVLIMKLREDSLVTTRTDMPELPKGAQRSQQRARIARQRMQEPLVDDENEDGHREQQFGQHCDTSA